MRAQSWIDFQINCKGLTVMGPVTVGLHGRYIICNCQVALVCMYVYPKKSNKQKPRQKNKQTNKQTKQTNKQTNQTTKSQMGIIESFVTLGKFVCLFVFKVYIDTLLIIKCILNASSNQSVKFGIKVVTLHPNLPANLTICLNIKCEWTCKKELQIYYRPFACHLTLVLYQGGSLWPPLIFSR